MDYNTSIQTNQTVGYSIAFQASMPAQPVPGPVTPPQPPHRKNRQFWIGCWRYSGQQTRMRWVEELILEKRSLRPKEKGSIRYRALAPLVTPEMWQEAERRLDNPLLAGPPPTLSISPLAAAALSPLPAPALVFDQWSTFNPGHGVAPAAPMGAFPAPAPAAAQGWIFAPGGLTPNQSAATGCRQPLPLPQTQLQPQPQGLSVPTRRHRLDLDDDDEIEAPQPKRRRAWGSAYTPPRPPQLTPRVNQTFGNSPGQSSTAYQFAPPVAPQPFPQVAPQLAPQVDHQSVLPVDTQTNLPVDLRFAPPVDPQLTIPVVPQSAPPAAPQFPSSVAPNLALPVAPQLAPAEPFASGWSAQTLPQEDLPSQELNADDLAITEETQLGQETQFLTQLGENNHADAAAEEAYNELFEDYVHADPVAEAAYEEDTHNAPVVEEANETETNALPNQPQEGSIMLPAQFGEETNEFVPPGETQNDEEPQQADPSSLPQPGTAPAPIDDGEPPEQQDDTSAQEDSELEEVDITSDRYLYGPLFDWFKNEQQFASQYDIGQVSL